MNKIKAEYQPYAGYSFKDSQDNLISNIEELWVVDSNGIEGKIKCVGSTRIYEHGFSGSENRYNFVDRDLNFRALENVEEFKTESDVKVYAEIKDTKASLLDECLKINSMNGTFYYDKPQEDK